MQAGRGLRRSWHLLTAGSAMRSDQLAQGFIQPGLENLQGWNLRNPSGQPVSDLTGIKANVTGFMYLEILRK